MKFYTDAEKRQQRARTAAIKQKRAPVNLTDPIAPCGDVSEATEQMKETAAEVAEEMHAGLDKD